jgi:hypothetical protein
VEQTRAYIINVNVNNKSVFFRLSTCTLTLLPCLEGPGDSLNLQSILGEVIKLIFFTLLLQGLACSQGLVKFTSTQTPYPNSYQNMLVRPLIVHPQCKML